ncbi:hypothetical protein L9F63_025414, partial [Diploptera punctata]
TQLKLVQRSLNNNLFLCDRVYDGNSCIRKSSTNEAVNVPMCRILNSIPISVNNIVHRRMTKNCLHVSQNSNSKEKALCLCDAVDTESKKSMTRRNTGNVFP